MGMHNYSPPPLIEVKDCRRGESLLDLRQVAALEWSGPGTARGGDDGLSAAVLQSGYVVNFTAPGYAEVKAAWKAALR